MSNLPPSSRYLQRADEAVEEIEREALAQRVSDAYADGRLEVESYRQSMDVIYGASTLGELVPVIKQLPAAAVNTPEIVGKGTLPHCVAGRRDRRRHCGPVDPRGRHRSLAVDSMSPCPQGGRRLKQLMTRGCVPVRVSLFCEDADHRGPRDDLGIGQDPMDAERIVCQHGGNCFGAFGPEDEKC